MFGERVRGGSHEALAQVGAGEEKRVGRVGRISLSVHTTQKGEGGRGDAMRRVCQQEAPSIRESAASAARGGRGGQGGYSSPRSLKLEA